MFKQAVELDRPKQHHLDALSAEGLLEELHAINLSQHYSWYTRFSTSGVLAARMGV